MTDADLIAQHIAKHGVTKCPPQTYGAAPEYTWSPKLNNLVQVKGPTYRDKAHNLFFRKQDEAARRKARMPELVERGLSPQQIANILRVSESTVRGYASELGIRFRVNAFSLKAEKIRQMIAQAEGKTIREISLETGLAKSTICKYRARAA